MNAPLRLAVALVVLALAGCAAPAGEPLTRGDIAAAPAPQEREWAPLEEAAIRPGVPIATPYGECPSNFVFIRPDNTSVFLGTTAYCVRDLPVGALVTVGGPENIGVLVYSSWITMQERGEQDPEALEYNDFAVVRVDDSSRDLVHPAMLGMGGPTGLADAEALATGERVLAFTPGGSAAGGWHRALLTGRAGGWALLAHGAPPALPGEMGGGVLTEDGRAVGVLVNLGVLPNPGANGIARLDAVMAYAREHAKLDMRLMTWDLEGGGVLRA